MDERRPHTEPRDAEPEAPEPDGTTSPGLFIPNEREDAAPAEADRSEEEDD